MQEFSIRSNDEHAAAKSREGDLKFTGYELIVAEAEWLDERIKGTNMESEIFDRVVIYAASDGRYVAEQTRTNHRALFLSVPDIPFFSFARWFDSPHDAVFWVIDDWQFQDGKRSEIYNVFIEAAATHVLYQTDWDNGKDIARRMIDANTAERIASKLCASAGWRERVSAARIVAAFDLKDLVFKVVSTFEEGPEHYTCVAFVQLVQDQLGDEGATLLDEMRKCCPNDSYGKHMIDIIDVRGVHDPGKLKQAQTPEQRKGKSWWQFWN